MYCIAILTDQEQEGQNSAEYIRNYCIEKNVFPLIEIYSLPSKPLLWPIITQKMIGYNAGAFFGVSTKKDTNTKKIPYLCSRKQSNMIQIGRYSRHCRPESAKSFLLHQLLLCCFYQNLFISVLARNNNTYLSPSKGAMYHALHRNYLAAAL